jgi:histone H3/H4
VHKTKKKITEVAKELKGKQTKLGVKSKENKKKKTEKKKKVIKPKIKQKQKAKAKQSEKIQKKKKNNSNVYNVGQHIRKNTSFKVSQSFVDETKDRIGLFIETLLQEAEAIAKAENMRTLQEHHLIRVFDYRLPDNVCMISCGYCGGSFTICSTDMKKDISCPFCQKKRNIIKNKQ